MTSPTRLATGRWLVTAGAMLATIALAGCDMGLQEKLDAKKTERYALAKSTVYGFEADRTKKLTDSLPKADAEFEGNRHPLLVWRQQAGTWDQHIQLAELTTHTKPKAGSKYATGLMGTPSERAGEYSATFMSEAREYWSGQSSTERYLGSINNFLTDSAAAQEAAKKANKAFVPPPLRDEATFDKTFVHVVRYLQLAKLNPGAAVSPQLQSYWELAFDFPAKRGSFSDYVSRICFVHPQMKERCKGVPHELRPMVVNEPYLQLLKGQVDSYKAAPENQVFNDVMGRFKVALDAALAVKPEIVEDPLLPSTLAPIGGISGLRILLSPKRGVWIHDKQIAETYTGSLPADFAAQATAVVTQLKNTPGNRINYQIIVIEAPGQLPSKDVSRIVSSFPPGDVTTVTFVGRRRIDDSMRRAPVRLSIPKDGARATQVKFQEDTAPRSCQYLGTMGEARTGAMDRYFLEITPTRIRAAEASIDDAGYWQVKETQQLGSPSDLSKLDAWLAENEGEVRIYMDGAFNYNDLLQHVTRVIYECKDEEVIGMDQTAEPLKRPCGAPEGRESKVRLAICN